MYNTIDCAVANEALVSKQQRGLQYVYKFICTGCI